VASTHLEDQLGWIESSRRYVTENEVFYIPTVSEWRSAPENRKQGSGGAVDPQVGSKCLQRLRASVERGIRDYEEALRDGVAPEQARLLLPAYAMYVRWRWTASLNSLLHFISLRLGHGAQYEIVEYAKAINEMVLQHYPHAAKAWNEHRI
jgi:thymidylate synthase (FAD)